VEGFVEYFKQLFGKSGLTKAELARKLKLKHQAYIGKIISGAHTPTIERVKQIAKILKCDQEETNKLLGLAINKRSFKKSYSIPPRHPYLRKLLLEYYTEKSLIKKIKEKPASYDKLKHELIKSPFHLIEKTLLEQSAIFLIGKMKIRSIESQGWSEAGKLGFGLNQGGSVEYFRMFTNHGKESKLQDVGLIWTYYPELQSLAYKIAREEPKCIFVGPAFVSNPNSYFTLKTVNNIGAINTEKTLGQNIPLPINKGLLEALVFKIKGDFLEPLVKDGQKLMLFYSHNNDDFKSGDYAVISLNGKHETIQMHENRLYKILHVSKNGDFHVQDIRGKSKTEFTAEEIDIKAKIIGILF
jgi:transcriptional regulator with XRE-family HTH domain